MESEEHPLLVDESRLITIPIQIQGTTQRAAVDSGSTLNIISNGCAGKHHLPVIECQRNISLRMADGTRATPDGETIMTFSVGPDVFTVPCVVLNGFPYECLLGMNFMRSAPLDIIASEGIVRVGKSKTEIEMPINDDCEALLFTSESVIVPPETKKIVKVSGRNLRGARFYLVEGLPESAPLLLPPLLARGRHWRNTSDLLVCVENHTSSRIKLRAGTRLATAVAVRSEDCMTAEEIDVHRSSSNAPAPPQPAIRATTLNIDDRLTQEQRQQFAGMLRSVGSDVFSRHEFDLGRTSLIKHRIDTGDAAPVRTGPYRSSFREREQIKQLVSGL